jgi:hypothetical protein
MVERWSDRLVRIEFTVEERGELGRAARAEKLPFQQVQRARIALYVAEGLADTEIAKRLDTSRRLVGRWRRRFAEQRLDGQGQAARGTPAPFSPRARSPRSTRSRASCPSLTGCSVGSQALSFIVWSSSAA